MSKRLATLLIAGVAVASLSHGAFAQKRHRVRPADPVVTTIDSSSPLTVNRRSWLDSGNATRTTNTGGPNYIAANTILNRTEDRIINPDKFGNAEIQGPPYVPGRSQPVVQGSILPNGGVVGFQRCTTITRRLASWSKLCCGDSDDSCQAGVGAQGLYRTLLVRWCKGPAVGKSMTARPSTLQGEIRTPQSTRIEC